MPRNKYKILLVSILSILLLLITELFFLRLISLKEVDDINPEIPCLKELIEESDTLWVIPEFNNHQISENKEWCRYILTLNKTIGMHGVYHEFEEFKTDRNQEYLQEGIDEFEKCFKFKPEIFKSPQLKISENNKKLIKENNLKLKGEVNQLMHKVYHCNDSGKFSNRLIDLF